MPTLLAKLLNRQEQDSIALSASAAELQGILAEARGESARLSGLTEQARRDIQEQSEIRGNLSELGNRILEVKAELKELEEPLVKARSVAELVENLEKRVGTLSTATNQTGEKVKAIREATAAAHQKMQEIEKVSASMDETCAKVEPLIQASLAADNKLASFRDQSGRIDSIKSDIRKLGGDLDGFQGQFNLIVEDYERIRDTTEALRQQSAAMDERAQFLKQEIDRADKVKEEIGDTLKGLSSSESFYKRAAQQLHQLNAFSDHIAKRTKALSVAKEFVDRANAQCTQVNELVWDTEQKIKQLNEQHATIGQVEENIERLVGLHGEITGKVADAERQRSSFSEQSARLKVEMEASVTSIRHYLEKASGMKGDFELANRRVTALNESIGSFEDRMKLLSLSTQEINDAVKSAENMKSRIEGFQEELDSAYGKMQAFESLEKRLDGMSELCTEVSRKVESITNNRAMIERTGEQITEFTKVQSELQADLEEIRNTRQEVDDVQRLFAEFRKASFETEYSVKQVMQRLETVDEVNSRIVSLQNLSEKLEGQTVELEARMEFVEGVESRINQLSELSQSIDNRMAEHLATRAELKSIRVAQEGLSLQLSDAQKVVASLMSSTALAEMENKMVDLQGQLQNFQGKLATIQQLEQEQHGRESRARDLVDRLDSLTSKVGVQDSRLRELGEEMKGLNDSRAEWLQAVGKVEARQRDIHLRSERTELQLKQITYASRGLEEKRADLALTEKKLSQHEERAICLERLLEGLDSKIELVNSRRQSVEQVGRQVAAIFDDCKRTRNDALSVMEAKKEILDAKEKLDTLLTQTEAVYEKFEKLESKRAFIDESEHKINALSHVMSDIHVSLQSFKKQKEVIDHIADKLARLEFSLKRAEVVTKALNEERELARRMYRSVRSLGTPSSGAAGAGPANPVFPAKVVKPPDEEKT